MARERVGLGLALLSAATFGTSGSFARSLTEAGWSPNSAVIARIIAAAVLLAVPGVVLLRGRWRILRREGWMVLGYGTFAVAGAQVCFFNAIEHVSVGVGLLLEYLGTILVVGWVWLRTSQRPRRLTVAGAATALVGLAFVLNLAGDTRLDPVGVLWGLGAAVGLAVFFVLSAQASDELPAIAMASAGMMVGAVLLVGIGLTGALPLHATFGTVRFAGHDTSWLVPVAGLSIIAASVSYVVGIGAARLLGAKLASFVGLTEVIFAVLFAWLLLGELPTPIQLVGGVLIVAGVALVRVDELSAPAVTILAAEPDPLPAGTGNNPEPRPAR
jgi:drug/metabolite transporter (DMT)-like permease